jgi:hypothetical protein
VSGGRATIFAGVAVAAAVAGVALLLLQPDRSGERAPLPAPAGSAPASAGSATPAPGRADGDVAAAPGADGPAAGGGATTRADPSDGGEGDAGGAEADPAAWERLVDEAVARIDHVGERARARDWDAVRAATEGIRRDAALHARLVAEAVERSGEPARALAGGLLLEELVEGSALTEDERFALGRALVPRLADGIARGVLVGEDADHATRLLSRFPDEDTEARLLALLFDGASDTHRRLLVLYAWAEVGAERTASAARGLLSSASEPELARVCGLCLFRVVARLTGGRPPQADVIAIGERLVPLFVEAAERGDVEATSRLATTLAETRGVSPPVYLATGVVPDSRLGHAARAAALELIAGWGDPTVLPALQDLRGRLGDPGLELLLERAVAELGDDAG